MLSTEHRRSTARIRRSIRGIAALAILVAILVYGVPSAVTAWVLTAGAHTPLTSSPSTIAAHWDDVSFSSANADRVVLRGWLLHASTHDARSAILVHGWQANRITAPIPAVARHLVSEGYDVLLFDLRACGLSSGDRFTLGVKEADDVVGAHDFMLSRGYDPGLSLVMGWSMGGSSVLEALPRLGDIAAIAEDSAYAELQPILDAEIPPRSHLPSLYNTGIETISQAAFGADPHLRPVDMVRAHPERALLIIHGSLDTFVPPNNADELAEASPNVDTVELLFPAGHVAAESVDPATYLRTLDRFVNRQLASRLR